MKFEEVKQKWSENYNSLFNQPKFDFQYIDGGKETLRDVQMRVISGLERLLNDDTLKNVLIITHREVINIILMHILGLPEDKLWIFNHDHGGLTLVISDNNSNLKIAFVNRWIS